jgi:hypothetical protein
MICLRSPGSNWTLMPTAARSAWIAWAISLVGEFEM